MHGDAAFAGQGVWAETLNMSELPGYNVGGSIHIVVNNLIGFTTDPRDSSSSRFCSDIAKRLPIPIFHVNAEDFEAVVRVGRMALDYRYAFEHAGGDRSGRLPSPRPQRGGRSHDYSAVALSEDRSASSDLANIYRKIRHRCRAHCAKGPRTAGRSPKRSARAGKGASHAPIAALLERLQGRPV